MKSFWKFALIVLVYGVAATIRPLWFPDEFVAVGGALNPAATLADQLNGLLVATFGRHPLPLRLLPLAATLGTAVLLWRFVRVRSAKIADAALWIYAFSFLVWCFATAATPLPLPVLGAVAVILGGSRLFHATGKERLAGGVELALGAIVLLAFSGAWNTPVGRGPELPGLLILGLLPFFPLLPLYIKGLHRAPWKKEPLLAAALAGLFLAAVAAFRHPAGGALLAMPFLAILAGYGLTRYFELEESALRFNRIIRTYVLLAGFGTLALIAAQMLGRFGQIAPQQLPYFPREHWWIAAIALIVLIAWWGLAMQEKNVAMKLPFFAIGVAFALAVLPLALPQRVTLPRDVAAPVRQLVAQQLRPGTRLVVAPDYAPVIRWVLPAQSYELLDLADPAAFEPGSQHTLVLTPTGEIPAKLPTPQRRWVYRPGSFSIQEYHP